MNCFDLYFLVQNRSRVLFTEFLDFVSTYRAETSDNYPLPIYADHPVKVYNTIDELTAYLEKAENESYSLYFRNLDPDSKVQTMMCFYTNDGKIILGVTVRDISIDGSETLHWCRRIREQFKPQAQYITFEEPPPDNTDAFLEFSRTRFNFNEPS